MAQPKPKNSSLNEGEEPYSEDDSEDYWTLEEVQKFEKILNQFDDPSPEFFQQVAHEMPWKTMESIKFQASHLMKVLGIIPNSDAEVISDEDQIISDEGEVICDEDEAKNDKGKGANK